MEWILVDLCIKNDLLKIKNFVKENPSVDVHNNNEEVFRYACQFGYLEIA